ncbi:MAG: DUF502 domain-containing protein, partial [Bacteroidales bacterium]
MKQYINRFFQAFFSYFFRGLFFIAPIFVTIYIFWLLFTWVDDFAHSLLEVLHIPAIPGMGILLTVVVVTLIGYLGGSIIIRPLLTWLDSQIVKLPFIKLIYTSIKDLMSAFVGKKKKFTEAVMVKASKESDLYKLGFITQTDLAFLGLSEKMVAVYLPHSYAFSGNLWLVPAENITPVQANAADVMKFIVSGGVAASADVNADAEAEAFDAEAQVDAVEVDAKVDIDADVKAEANALDADVKLDAVGVDAQVD